MMTQLAEFLGPNFKEELIRAFGSSILSPSPVEDGVMDDDEDTRYINAHVGYTTSEYLWDRAWRFGLVLDVDVQAQRSCGDLWRPNGRIETAFYIPDDHDTEVPLVAA